MDRIYMRGIRGAISVQANKADEIYTATMELLETIVKENALNTEDIASVLFTVTNDLDADFPAHAARDLGWQYVPLLCATEISVPGSMPKVIRVLMHVNTTRGQQEIKHVYLRDAGKLRKDLLPQ